ncbi:MAG: AAA family ATPase [Lacunisphaera sp.]|nr:AAA family ATPase [Lacunisphaera sp.]
MITAVHFRNFKALRSAAVKLEPFNLLIGPSGSGKTSLIQALLRLRTLSGLPSFAKASEGAPVIGAGPQIEFHFGAPFPGVRVTLGCNSDQLVCNLLVVDHPPGIAGEGQWAELRTQLQGIRVFLFDHYAMAVPAKRSEGAELASNAANLAAVLAMRQTQAPEAMKHLEKDFCRILPEFGALDFRDAGDGRVELLAKLADGREIIPAENLSQGTLYLLAILCLAHDPQPPSLICLEEADRGVHPRLLREVRDACYRLSHPLAGSRAPVQVIATTHSPYLLDLFRDHPEEIVLANKHGNAATFERLSERPDLLELMKETNLGDLWYSGIIGGVPGET